VGAILTQMQTPLFLPVPQPKEVLLGKDLAIPLFGTDAKRLKAGS